jgi:cytochrome c peroxidase
MSGRKRAGERCPYCVRWFLTWSVHEQRTGLTAIDSNDDELELRHAARRRNVALQPAFFHNGAFTLLNDATRHHLDVLTSLRNYDAKRAGLAPDLTSRLAPVSKVAASIDPLLRKPLVSSAQEFSDLLAFVGTSLLDGRMLAPRACALVPKLLPSGAAPLRFEACR